MSEQEIEAVFERVGTWPTERQEDVIAATWISNRGAMTSIVCRTTSGAMS